MTFGGTSWGWLPAPVVYTSYDYGAAFDEARQIRPKATAMKEIGLLLQAVPDVAKLDKGDPVTPSSPAVRIYDDVNPDTGAHLYVAVHDPSNATTDDAFTFPIPGYTVPQSGTLHLGGQDAKLLLADVALAGQQLVYSTSEVMTTAGDVVVLHGRDGEDGETMLRYRHRPHVAVLAGDVSTAWDAARGDLRLDYVHHGLARVRISGGGRRTVTLLLADTTTAGTFWRQDTPAGPVLERGPELVRGAAVHRSLLALRGDTAKAEPLEVWAPRRVHKATWNGRLVFTRRSPSGSLQAARDLPGPEPVGLPDLTRATWRYAPESPEAEPGFDDAGWASADHTTTNSTTPPPPGQPVLTADDYGFHQGDVWYRGRFEDRGGGDHRQPALRRRRRGDAAGLAGRALPGPARPGHRRQFAADHRDRQLRDPRRPAHRRAARARGDGS